MFKIKTEIPDTVTADIRSDHSSLRPQEAMVLQEKYKALEIIDKANDTLNSKAMTMLQSGGMVAALLGITNIPGLLSGKPSGWSIVFVASGLIAFIVMIYFSLLGFLPDEYYLPGEKDRDMIYQDYIHPDVNVSFWKVFDDLEETIELIIERNKKKVGYIKRSAFLLIFEIGALACVLFINALK